MFYWQHQKFLVGRTGLYECEKGFIRFRGNFWFGSAGIEGSLGIGIPPVKNPTIEQTKMSQNAWEGSHSLENWDWWKCLGVTTIPPTEGNSWEFGFLCTSILSLSVTLVVVANVIPVYPAAK